MQTATRVQFLQAGKVDLLIASMELNPDRAETLGYAPTPFYRVGGTAAVRKGSGIARWEDLRGKPVCVSQGSSFAKPLASEYGARCMATRARRTRCWRSRAATAWPPCMTAR
ncbi:hypothetical protein GY14_24965 [Delftia tsuruhatensis]|nr:hypothetical protein GY14_24965 [Delftia tsuruhatensis]